MNPIPTQPPGAHLRLKAPGRFQQDAGSVFYFSTMRVCVVRDSGVVVDVLPVDEESGELPAGMSSNVVSFPCKRELFDGPWKKRHRSEWCHACKGTGRRAKFVPPAMTADQAEVAAKVLEPFCPVACRQANQHDIRQVHLYYGDPEKEWSIGYHLNVCRACGRLRSGTDSRRLRRVYRGSLRLVRE